MKTKNIRAGGRPLFRTIPWRLSAALTVVTACMTTIPVNDRDGGDREWSRYVELSAGEQALFDGGAFELTLVEIEANAVTVRVERDGALREDRLRTGLVVRDHVPYEIRLVSTSVASDTATIEVAKR